MGTSASTVAAAKAAAKYDPRTWDGIATPANQAEATANFAVAVAVRGVVKSIEALKSLLPLNMTLSDLIDFDETIKDGGLSEVTNLRLSSEYKSLSGLTFRDAVRDLYGERSAARDRSALAKSVAKTLDGDKA